MKGILIHLDSVPAFEQLAGNIESFPVSAAELTAITVFAVGSAPSTDKRLSHHKELTILRPDSRDKSRSYRSLVTSRKSVWQLRCQCLPEHIDRGNKRLVIDRDRRWLLGAD